MTLLPMLRSIVAPGLAGAMALLVTAFGHAGDLSKGGPVASAMQCYGASRADQDLTTLRQALRLSAGQEALWANFAAALVQAKGTMKTTQSLLENQPSAAPARIALEVEFLRQRLVAFEVVAEAANELYAALGPEQESSADRGLLVFSAGRATSGVRCPPGVRHSPGLIRRS
jgi:LTXXQ motif family protein